MKTICLRKTGGPEVLSLEDSDALGQPSEREVQIEVHYSGINFADIMMRLGLYPDAPKRPYVPGYEVSGIVKKVGAAVTQFKSGDSVFAGTLFGGYASHVSVAEDLVFHVPSYLSLAEAAAIPVNWITAHAAILDMGRARRGDRVLVDAATGGVGTLALQILKHTGAETIGLTSSRQKIPYIESLGAQGMTHDEFAKSKESHFDLILNSQGGSSVRDHYDLLGATGRVVALGMSGAISNGKRDYLALIKTVATMPRFSLVSMFEKNRGVYALNALTLLQDPIYRKSLRAKWASIESIQLRPHVDQIFSASRVGEAQHFLETKQAKGKVILSWV